MRSALALGFLTTTAVFAVAEEYRLVHAIDNDETVIRSGLTETQCHKIKADFIKSTTIVIEVNEENPKLGTLACLPESAFD